MRLLSCLALFVGSLGATTGAHAKCSSLFVSLTIIHGGGGLTFLNPDTTFDGGDVLKGLYSPIVLMPGDSLSISFSGSSVCDPTNNVWRNGSLVFQSAGPNGQIKLAQPGNYKAESWDNVGYMAHFQIVGSGALGGPIQIHAGAFLQGAMDDSEMIGSTVPFTTVEPYSSLGFTQVAGGGEYFDPYALPVGFWTTLPVDWILVELRDAVQPSAIVCTKSALLMNDGRLLDPITYGDVWLDAPPGNYYVAVRHRNHMGAMTATPIALSSTPTTVDFRDPALPTWGTNARVIAGNQALLRMGNVNRTGTPQQVKYSGLNNDRDPILVKIGGTVPTASVSGYFVEDANLDGVVKYTGAGNDRDLILQAIGGAVPTAVVTEQLP